MMMAIKTEMETWMTQLVAATPTQYELKQHSWLEKVSVRATVEECGMATYLWCPCHPSTTQNVHMDMLDGAIHAEGSRLNL